MHDNEAVAIALNPALGPAKGNLVIVCHRMYRLLWDMTASDAEVVFKHFSDQDRAPSNRHVKRFKRLKATPEEAFQILRFAREHRAETYIN